MYQRYKEFLRRSDYLLGVACILMGIIYNLGGKEKNKHFDKRLDAGRGTIGKQVVLGLRERTGFDDRFFRKTPVQI